MSGYSEDERRVVNTLLAQGGTDGPVSERVLRTVAVAHGSVNDLDDTVKDLKAQGVVFETAAGYELADGVNRLAHPGEL